MHGRNAWQCARPTAGGGGAQATGKVHTLWSAFARFYERHGDLDNARVIFEKATQARPGLAARARPGLLARAACARRARRV